MARLLGQFMTPDELAHFVATQISTSDVVIDLASGDGSLLRAVGERFSKTKLFGFDIDQEMVDRANSLPRTLVLKRDGLKAKISPEALSGSLTIVGNPPFLNNRGGGQKWISTAFPNLIGKKGTDRAEVQFLARALALAKKFDGRVVFVMPIGFADGDTYRNLRAALTEEFNLLRCVEIIGAAFCETEARTVVIVVEPKRGKVIPTEILEYNVLKRKLKKIRSGILEPGSRLDARYHRAAKMGGVASPIQLKDIPVSITRGLVSRKEAELLNLSVLHTSHIGKASLRGTIRVRSKLLPTELEKHVIARKGDILLSRTGSRVSWSPILLSEGAAPITDHVFRIRAAKEVQKLVLNSFRHPSFNEWLSGIAKGVCATVITKRELMEMPLFAWKER